MKVEQHFYKRVQNVYNVDGTLILSAESRTPDLVREIANMRAQVAALDELEGSTRQEVTAELAAAEAESKTAAPKGATIKAHLDSAAGALEGASGVAENAGKLAKTLFDIGKWAAALLV
jgi:hypothetical protein